MAVTLLVELVGSSSSQSLEAVLESQAEDLE